MTAYSGATRWWEGYLVRYFIPSIAGIAIILWVSTVAGNEFRKKGTDLFFGSNI